MTQVVCGTRANVALTQATQVSDSTQLEGKGGGGWVGVQFDEEVIHQGEGYFLTDIKRR